jgi:hypothetical protein
MMMMDSRSRPVRPSKRRANGPQVMELEDRRLMTMLGQSLFPADNAWNQNISAAPVAANSTSIINNIVSVYGNTALHPDFGQDTRTHTPLYGIPYNVAHGNTQAKVHVVIDAYASESDLVAAPIPANAVIEGDYQDGPLAGVNNRGDSHLIIWDADNNVAYEFYRASRPSENADGQWHADGEAVWDMKTDTFRTLGYTSADAAGLAILPGLVRPDEGLPTSQGGQGQINHAIRFTLKNSLILNKYQYPASHVANSNTNTAIDPAMGSRFRLKAGVDISTLNPEAKVIAQAMKTYGLILSDNGSNLFTSGASYSVDTNNNFALTWNEADIQDATHGLKSLYASDFEMVDLKPIVTGLSATTAAAGSTLTVVGRNFSGAAGHLQVFFGSTAATSVSIVDDAHLTITVPTGSGSVDVTVESGVTTAPSSQNVTSPVFGYGVSAKSTADHFTYGTITPPHGPTIVSPVSATQTAVTGKTTTMSVTATDPAGASQLTYTWVATSKPAGSTPVYSANGTNAASTTTVTFDKVGYYRFYVTVADAAGLKTTSTIAIAVNTTLTRIAVSPNIATVVLGATQQFSALAYDQFATLFVTQPRFTWGIASGGGRVSTTGLFTAAIRAGTSVVRASYGSVSGTASVSIV